MNTARNDGGGTGTQTAGLAYGGDAPGASNATEHYDGTSWTNANNMLVAVDIMENVVNLKQMQWQ